MIETHAKKIQAANKITENEKSKSENGTAITENGVAKSNGKKKSSKKNKAETEEVAESSKVETNVNKKKKRKSEQADKNDQSDTPKKKSEKNCNDIGESPKKKKKVKHGNQETIEECTKTEDSIVNDKLFSWKEIVVGILSKKADGLSKNSLQSKVFKKYKKIKGFIENEETLIKKYNKKLKAMKTITFENDIYKLVELS